MKARFPFSLQRFRLGWKPIGVFLLFLLYFFINLFKIGGYPFIGNLNNILPILLAFSITVISGLLFYQIPAGSNRYLWLGLTIGWGFWAIAEAWWAVADHLSQELPYPSGADFFWAIAYIPLFIALGIRTFSLPRALNLYQKIGMLLAVVGYLVAAVILVLQPVIENLGSESLFGDVLSVFYPLADIALFALSLQILFSYRQGRYGHAWGWISAGFAMFCFSDLLFSYAVNAGVYYPEGELNLLSTVGIDVTYTASYLLCLIGLTQVQALQVSSRPFQMVTPILDLVPNTHIFALLKNDDTVTSVSGNYSRIFRLEMEDVGGKTISEVFGIPPEEATALINEVKMRKISGGRPLLVRTRFGAQQAFVAGMSVAGPEGKGFGGMALLLWVFSEDYELDRHLNENDKWTVQLLLDKTNFKEREELEIKKLILDYYAAYLKAFYNRVLLEGGGIMADAFWTELQSRAQRRGWKIDFDPDHFLDISVLSLKETRECLPVLLEAARDFTARVIDHATAEAIGHDVHSKFSEMILRNVSFYETAGEVSF